MKIGLGVYTGDHLPSEGISRTESFRNDITQAKVAEDAALDSVWVSEHHFLPSGSNGSVFTTCAAWAATTERIGLGISVVLAPLWHPVRLAEDSVAVDVLSGGRFTLGVGLGYRDEEYAGMGVARRTRGAYTDELLQVVRQAWSDEPVDFDGRFFDLHGVPVTPKPVRPAGIPIWVAGHVDAAFDRAARYADGFAMDGGTDADVFTEEGHNRDLFWRVQQTVDRYKAALARVGKDYPTQEFALTIGGFLSDVSADDAWATQQDAYMLTRRTYAEWYGVPRDVSETWYPDRMSPEEHARRRSEVWLGTPDDLAPAMRRLHDIVGDNLHVMFRVRYPGIDHEKTCAAIRLLGELRRLAGA